MSGEVAKGYLIERGRGAGVDGGLVTGVGGGAVVAILEVGSSK